METFQRKKIRGIFEGPWTMDTKMNMYVVISGEVFVSSATEQRNLVQDCHRLDGKVESIIFMSTV
jgi:hypothetical protein